MRLGGANFSLFWRPGAAARYQCAVQQMLEQEPLGRPPGEARGRIVNQSFQHGMISAPNAIAYGVSKAGCAYITRQIAADYAKQRIVCARCGQRGPVPGQRRGQLHDRRQPHGRRRLDGRLIPRIADSDPLHRIGAFAAIFVAGQERARAVAAGSACAQNLLGRPACFRTSLAV